ncbi:ABC transporter permease [Sedimentitalea sp. XS_ASV28]|uniref:ABC transporter permease n=1 Tax=Sedimentitalea sp. XS_ASV28 TaxID=3241296 RepID=UPI003518204C
MRLWLGLVGVLLLAVLSLFIGVIPISPRDVFTDPEATRLMVTSRLPRTLAALLAGAALAITGQIMQVLARNRFVEPMTAGAGQSAALGVLLATLLIPGAPVWIKMCLAAATTLAGSVGLLVLIRPLPPTQPLLVPLVALIYGGLIGAAVNFVAYQGDMMQYLQVWLTGELSGVLKGRYELLWIAGGAAAATWFIAGRITLLNLGDDVARSLGINVRNVTAAGLLAVSVVTAMVVVTLGAIPFVGLVVPNLVSRRMGDNLPRTLPFTALIGAGLVLAADICGRTIRAPFEVPVAAVIGVVGAVLFLILLYREPRHG